MRFVSTSALPCCVALASAALVACAPVPLSALKPQPAAPVVRPATTFPAAAPSAIQVVQGPDTPAKVPTVQAFQDWLHTFSAQAQAAGIDAATLQTALGTAQYIPRIVELDRAQPEFNRSIWDYLDVAVSPQRIQRGQDKLRALQVQLAPIAAHYGVPLEVLFAFWGIESDFGNHVGNFSVIDALATLGFDGRREAWAQRELLAALKILQNHDIERSQMVGSWAGAMGQTQFMPTVFLAEAVDQDGDGRRDLWGSIPDVMASTANFVVHSGWQAGQPWLVEVQLPADFDYALADPDTRMASADWARRGVKAIASQDKSNSDSNSNSASLPPLADASILLPAGARGPAFLVGPNYRAILKYNNATSYAMAVSLLARQLAGEPGVQAAWPRAQQTLTRSAVRELQVALNARGMDVGIADGLMGPNTLRGVRQLQRSLGLPPDGFPTRELLVRVQTSPAPTP